jgi:hypothetical protein
LARFKLSYEPHRQAFSVLLIRDNFWKSARGGVRNTPIRQQDSFMLAWHVSQFGAGDPGDPAVEGK